MRINIWVRSKVQHLHGYQYCGKMDIQQDVISPFELEEILTRIDAIPIEKYGSTDWSQQMSMIEELNVQAALEAHRGGEELVRDQLVEAGLLPTLVKELLGAELWRAEALPRILKKGKLESTFQIYMVLFNEVNITNLLETILYNSSACEALGDSSIDLTDYCVRQLAKYLADGLNSDDTTRKKISSAQLAEELANWKPGMALPDLPVEDVSEELDRHLRETHFQICMKCVTILRYMTDHIDFLPLGVTTRLVITHDTPVLLIQILEEQPWSKKSKDGSRTIFEGSDWKTLEDDSSLPKIEAQAWIGLYNLLSKKTASEKYEIHSYRRGMLLKLQQHLNEHLLNQLPILSDLRRWVLELSMGSQPSAPSMNNIMIEPIAEIRESLIDRYKKSWDSIASEQSTMFLCETVSSAMIEQAGRIMKAFDADIVQQLASSSGDSFKNESDDKKLCVVCKKSDAKSRCSRCHTQRYCSRECQIQHWSKHKLVCKEKTEN